MNRVITLLIILLVGTMSFSQDDEAALRGKDLFLGNCASCHKIDAAFTGPPLNAALEEWDGDKNAMYTWVRNWSQAVEEGYPRAIEVQSFDPSAMNLFPTLTDEQLDDIFAYVANPGVGSEGGSGAAVTGEPKTGIAAINWLLVGILILFIVLALILSQISDNLERLVAEKEGKVLTDQEPFFQRIFNKKVMSLLALIAVGVIGFVTYNSAAALGRTKGYAPEQPIAFSHKLHAGTLGVECLYCHTSAGVGKQATIPATDVCMNCHVAVSEGPTTGTREIAKIYASAGFNPSTLEYDLASTGPIEWKRLHNLPDHVYFNHSQHVTVGNVECQTCHGPIEEMDVVKQYSDLSMGWCINCHRETEVQFTQNAYYDELFEEYHNKLKSKDKEFLVTVEKIGGTECQKCHY